MTRHPNGRQFELFRESASDVPPTPPEPDETEELLPLNEEVVQPTPDDEKESFEAEHPGAKYIPPKTRAEREEARRRREEILRRGRVDILGEKGQPSLPTKPKR